MEKIKKFVAKAVPGKEYLYDGKSAHAVPVASADYICKVLNQHKYKGADQVHSVWHVFDCDGGEEWHLPVIYQQFKVRKGIVTEVIG